MNNKQKISPDRFRRLRTALGLSQSEFGEVIGVSRNYVGMLERGTQIVGADSSIGLLFELIESDPRNAKHLSFPAGNAAELEALENPSRGGFSKTPNVSEFSESAVLRDEPPGRIAKSSGFTNKSTIREIPVIGWAHAGQAASYEELPESWQEMIPTHCRDAKAFGVRLEGDSMEPLFRDGDLLVLMPGERIHNGCLAVVRLASDGVLLRRIEVRGDRLRLVPLNPRYEAEELACDQVSWAYPVWGRWSQIWK